VCLSLLCVYLSVHMSLSVCVCLSVCVSEERNRFCYTTLQIFFMTYKEEMD